MSNFRVRFSRWLLIALLTYLASLFIAGYCIRALYTNFGSGLGRSVFLGVVVLCQFGCAYFSPFLPARGLRRHLAAGGVGAVTTGGLLLTCFSVEALARP